MAIPAEHLEAARAHRTHAEMLLREHRNDPTAVQWAVTAIYYCGLHCLSAHLAGFGVTCTTHGDRRRALRDPRFGVPLAVRLAYRHLQTWSHQGRYAMSSFDATVVEYTALRLYLERITAFVGL